MSSAKMFSVDKFLGLNEAADGETELKMGQASRTENWMVTDGYNLKVRPGFQRVDPERPSSHLGSEAYRILAAWCGTIGVGEYLVVVDLSGSYTDRILMFSKDENGKFQTVFTQEGALGIEAPDCPVKIFTFSGKLYIMSGGHTVVYNDGEFVTAEPYVPRVITGAAPSGGGTMLENLNLLTPLRRMDFSADGEATAYVLPEEATGITELTVDNVAQDIETAGTFDAQTHTVTFAAAPAKGVGNVEVTYSTDEAAAEESRLRIANMKLVEAYNGSTDTRLFMAGDGTNVCCYSGIPAFGDASALYFPAMNEVAVDMSAAPVTGLVRHYSKLLAFTTDGAYTITYEPVTLEDGTVTAGFYLRPANRIFGHETMGQIQTVRNYPRTFFKGSIYEWRITSSYYQDERYAKRVSDMVEKTLRRADPGKIVTCDDNYEKTYYVFLNDEEGTVLVNRYELGDDGGLWCIYKSGRCRDVQSALMCGDTMVVVTAYELFYLDSSSVRDAADHFRGDPEPIKAVWESGYMDFGAAYLRKFSSKIYVSILPEASSWLTITASTDRQESHTEKVISSNVFNFANVNFARWSFNMNLIPKISRVRLKVRKFIYYKLIFKVEGSGDRATILSYDQEVRFGNRTR